MNKTSLLELAKRLSIPRRKDFFGLDIPTYTACLYELQKQQKNDEYVYNQKLMILSMNLLGKDFKKILCLMIKQ